MEDNNNDNDNNDIFDVFKSLNKGSNKLVHNSNAYNDLQIEEDIFKIINKTVTGYGAKKLKNRLAYTYYDIDDLQEMTNKNVAIARDHIYIDKMNKYLHEIKLVETNIDKWMIDEFEKDLIFSSSYFNLLNNRFFLTLSNKLKFSSIFIVIFFYLFIYLWLNYVEIPVNIYEYAKSIIMSYKYFAQFVLYYFMTDDNWIENLSIMLVVLYVGYQCYMFYQAIMGCYNHYHLCNNFYDNYTDVIKLTETVTKMIKIEKHIKNNIDIYESIEYLQTYFDRSSSLGYSLVSKLNTNDYQYHINVLCNYIGRVDYAINVAQLLKDSFTIPLFVKSNYPKIEASNMWNPLIIKEKRIKNDIKIDQTTPNLMIITGPNKAGKSTFMRTVLLNVYLSHSIGLSCCDSLTLTPFRDLYTYLNIPDCVGRESLFEAELNRCYGYVKKIEDFKGFSLGLIDELFTGTNPKEGMAGSYAIVKRLLEMPVNITIMSTHFHDMLKKLGTDEILYMKFCAQKNDEKKYVFDYLIQPGISNQCIALELLKEKGFDKSIIDNADQYFANL